MDNINEIGPYSQKYRIARVSCLKHEQCDEQGSDSYIVDGTDDDIQELDGRNSLFLVEESDISSTRILMLEIWWKATVLTHMSST